MAKLTNIHVLKEIVEYIIVSNCFVAMISLMSASSLGALPFELTDSLVSGCTQFSHTLVEDDETCLGALKGTLVRMHVHNNL